MIRILTLLFTACAILAGAAVHTRVSRADGVDGGKSDHAGRTGGATGGPATRGGADTRTVASVAVPAARNRNQPPVVTLSSPVANARDIGNSATISAGIADPKGGAHVVTFYGRVAAPEKPGPDFSVIAIPDSQYYSENTGRNPSPGGTGAVASIFHAQTQWIVDNRETRKIAFVSHMGDIVQNGDTFQAEWLVADGAMKRIENQAATLRAFGIPWGCAPGNHDYGTAVGIGTTACFNQYFGTARFAGRNYYGGNFGTNNNNNYELFSAGGLDFIVLHLEYDAGAQTGFQPALDWANAVLEAHPHRRAIVTSHWIVNTGNPAAFSTRGRNIYDALNGNPNLFLMLCGHVHGEGRRSDFFARTGRTVHSVLQDYQEGANGGNGFLRIFTFSPANGTITVESYSPVLGRAVNATDDVPGWTAAFKLPYDMRTPVTDWIPLGTVNVPAHESKASLAWIGLEAGRDYEWYAVADDGVKSVASGARRFSTAAPVAPAVTLTSPADGSSIAAPGGLQLTASASDADGTIARVEFYQGGTKLAELTTAPYQFTWSNVPAGNYALTAVAVDNDSLATISRVVNVTVTQAQPPRPIPSPAEGSNHDVPADRPR